MNDNIEKNQSCNYSKYEKVKEGSNIEDCPNLATRTISEIDASYSLCEEHYQLLTRQSER